AEEARSRLLRPLRTGPDQREERNAALDDVARLEKAAGVALVDVLTDRNCGDRPRADARERLAPVIGAQRHDRVVPALDISREATAIRMTMRLILVVTEREDRPSVLRPERRDPDAVAVVLRLVRVLAGKDDATVAAQGLEIGADEAAVLLVRRERQRVAAVQPHRPQRRVGDVALRASIARPEKNRLHFRRVE